MTPKNNVEMVTDPKKVTGIGPKYLDWWMGHDKPPSHKNLSDNLRAYLTIGAYIVLFHYLWFWGDDRIPGWVFRGAAIIWGVWVFWFFVLTFIQTWHLYLGFCFELIDFFITPYALLRKGGKGGEITDREKVVITILFLPFGWSSLILVGTVVYLLGAMLRSAKLM